MIKTVVISKSAEKDILKLPSYIQIKLRMWVSEVERLGYQRSKKFLAIMTNH